LEQSQGKLKYFLIVEFKSLRKRPVKTGEGCIAMCIAKASELSPETYGQAFIQFAKAMKAVDPRIKVGASLDIPVTSDWDIQEYTQDPVTGQYVRKNAFQKKPDSGLEWDRGVLKAAGKDVDFVSLHWNTGATTESSGFKNLDNGKLLAAPHDELPQIVTGLVDLFQKYCGENAHNMQMLVTAMGPETLH
jgi:hypothetical protein